MREFPEYREVKVMLDGGIVYLIECPPDVVVKCLDHDQGEADYFELSTVETPHE